MSTTHCKASHEEKIRDAGLLTTLLFTLAAPYNWLKSKTPTNQTDTPQESILAQVHNPGEMLKNTLISTFANTTITTTLLTASAAAWLLLSLSPELTKTPPKHPTNPIFSNQIPWLSASSGTGLGITLGLCHNHSQLTQQIFWTVLTLTTLKLATLFLHPTLKNTHSPKLTLIHTTTLLTTLGLTLTTWHTTYSPNILTGLAITFANVWGIWTLIASYHLDTLNLTKTPVDNNSHPPQ